MRNYNIIDGVVYDDAMAVRELNRILDVETGSEYGLGADGGQERRVAEELASEAQAEALELLDKTMDLAAGDIDGLRGYDSGLWDEAAAAQCNLIGEILHPQTDDLTTLASAISAVEAAMNDRMRFSTTAELHVPRKEVIDDLKRDGDSHGLDLGEWIEADASLAEEPELRDSLIAEGLIDEG